MKVFLGLHKTADGEWVSGDVRVPGHSAPLPAGAVVMESDGEKTAWLSSSGPAVPRTEAAYENHRSFTESYPYLIRLPAHGEAIRCECCGAFVALVPEAFLALAYEPLGVHGPWKPGIWEYESLRKHTMRRCEWKRANP